MESLLLDYYGADKDAFRKLLRTETERIWILNPERLLGILYRIDIKEDIVHRAFALGPCEESFELLTDAIVERMEQKRKYRNDYR